MSICRPRAGTTAQQVRPDLADGMTVQRASKDGTKALPACPRRPIRQGGLRGLGWRAVGPLRMKQNGVPHAVVPAL